MSIQVFPSRQVFFFVICCRIHKACVWMGHGVTCKHLYIYICAFCMESLTIHILYMQMGRFDRRARAFCPKIHKNKSRPGNSVPLITHCASTKSWADMTNGLCQKITTNSIIYSYRWCMSVWTLHKWDVTLSPLQCNKWLRIFHIKYEIFVSKFSIFN